jgi:rubrerythrin
MEHRNYDFDRVRFDAVWQRVMPELAPATTKHMTVSKQTASEDAERLREQMNDEAGDARYYGMLACILASKGAGDANRMLSRISADERCHLKRLRARYFILTGETYTPPDTCPLIYSAPDALRRKYAGEKEGAAAYRAAAEATADADLKETYLALAEDEARHSRTIGRIIENMI